MKKILSFVIAFSMVLSILPIYVKAAETGPEMPTRIQTETLVLSDEAAGDESEGWQWKPNETGGGTLILENCYIQSDGGIFRFDNVTAENHDINIILRGKNILETTHEEYYISLIETNMIDIDGVGWGISNYIISEEGEGSLEIRTDDNITSDMSPYVFAGGSITIESGDIETNLLFCMIVDDFSVNGGSLKIHTPAETDEMFGIYTINGPVNISGGIVDIDVSYVGIYIAGIPAQNRGNQTVNISGGDVNIKSGFSGIHIQSDDMGENAQTLNITGGNVTCYGEATGLYAKNVNIEGSGDSEPIVDISKGEASTYPSIISRTNKVTISGSIVTADGIAGYDNENSVIEDSIVFDGKDGKVYGNVELTEDFSAPDGAVLLVPDGATLSVSEDVVLSGPEGTALEISGTGEIVNNGTIVLPENNAEINSTGTGVIKKGDNLYTNDNEQLYTVTIKQKENEITEYYKEGDIVTLVSEADTEDMKFKEWIINNSTIVVKNNQFTMPAENVAVEAVFERYYKLTIKQPSGTITEYHKEGESISLVPEEAEGSRFKEWKITPATVVVTDNQFTMPAEEVTVEAVYEEIPSETEPPLPTGSSLPTEPVFPTESSLPTSSSTPTDNPTPTKNPDSAQTSGGLSTYPVSSTENIITTISASPVLGGIVSGNTKAVKGENVTITAVANVGYTFVEWTEEGRRVSADAKYTFKAEKSRTLVAVFKQNTSENEVQNIIPDKINVDNNIKVVASAPLPVGWEWSSQDGAKVISAGGSVTATAVYTVKDSENYNKTSLITITRDACEEDVTVLYTGEGEYEPDCTTDGLGHTECKLCGDIVREGIKVPATGHMEGEAVIKKATINKDGSSTSRCIKCNEILSKDVISGIKTIKLSKNNETYNKKVQNPSVSVKDNNGNLLKQGIDYTISYTKGMKKVGIYNVKITFIGRYEGTADKTYKIIPKGTSISKVKAGKKGFTLEWEKQTAQTTGYQIQYSTNKKFTKKTIKKVTVKANNIISKYINCGNADKKYYTRIRTYKNVNIDGKVVKVFSGWSKVKTVKIKK